MRAAMFAAISGRRGPGIVTPSTQRIVFDGNSFLDPALPYDIGALVRADPFGATFSGYGNIGISGQSWEAMLSSKADLTSQLTQGPTCLVLMETTNSVYNLGDSASAVLSAIQSYTSWVKVNYPSTKIFVCGTVPRWATSNLVGGYTNATANQALIDVDSAISSNPTAYGADGFISLRGAGGPFAFADFSGAGFNANASGYADVYVHPSAMGRAWIASQIVGAVRAAT